MSEGPGLRPNVTGRLIVCVASLAALVFPAFGQKQQPPTFRAGVRTVEVYATVSDGAGRLVPDLGRDAFQVLDNGRPIDITVFSNEARPITVAIMLDMSNSMSGRVLLVRRAAQRFVQALVPGDRVRIGTFNAEVAVSPILTDDHAVLDRVLAEELWPGGFTPLWRALTAAMGSLEGQTGRRVVLVLTDGDDTDTAPKAPSARDVKRAAVRDSFMVYAIGLAGARPTITRSPSGVVIRPPTGSGVVRSDDYVAGLSDDMVDVAEETGGGHFDLKSEADLGDTFARVAEELRHQYLIGFSPATVDGKVHKLEIRVTRAGCIARARKSYVARAEGE